MTHPDTHLFLAAHRDRELRAEAADWARAQEAVRPASDRPALRTRVGWTLVDLGLRLATTPRPAMTTARA